jgi:H-NS histone family protein
MLTVSREMENGQDESFFNVSRCTFDIRDDVEKALSGRAKELQDQLSRLGRASGFRNRGRGSSLKGRKVPIKYRDRSGNTWAGRGAQPVWLREKLKGDAKLEGFAVHKTVASLPSRPPP